MKKNPNSDQQQEEIIILSHTKSLAERKFDFLEEVLGHFLHFLFAAERKFDKEFLVPKEVKEFKGIPRKCKGIP